jgi:hypothetical protein
LTNKEHTQDIFDRLKGTLVLIDRQVLRFIGIGQDQYDYLYILWDGKKITYRTILSNLIQLKNKIDKKDYDSMINSSMINDYDSKKCFNPKSDKDRVIVANANNNVKQEVLAEIDKHNIDLLDDLFWDIK